MDSEPRHELASKKVRRSEGDDDKVAKEIETRTVDFSSQNMSDAEATTVIEGFLTVPRTLIMRNNKLDGNAAKALARAVVDEGRILDVGLNNIGEEGADALAQALGSATAKLKKLRIDSNFVGDAAISFAEALATRGCPIEFLDLADNDLNEADVVAIANALKRNSTIRVLDLACNNVGNAAICALADMLKVNTTLIALRLNSNDQIGTEGAKAIASALQTNESLATVDLSQADITGEGAAYLAEALKGNRSISSMLLNDTNLCPAALSCFRDCLLVNKTLSHLPGTAGLDEMLQSNLKRQELLADFAGNGDLGGMRQLIAGGVGREVLPERGLTVYHVCIDNERSDMLSLLLAGRVRLGQGFVDLTGLQRGRKAACVEIRRFVEVRMIAFYFAWNRKCSCLALIPRDIMNLVVRKAFESWSLPYKQKK